MTEPLASFSATVHGTPPRKNRRHAHGGHSGPVRNSPEYLAWCEQLGAAWAAASNPALASGTWRLRVTAVWPRKRDLGGVVVAFGDVDAPISAVLDALQRCGAIDDDVRVIELRADKQLADDSETPKTIIHLEMLEDDDG